MLIRRRYVLRHQLPSSETFRIWPEFIIAVKRIKSICEAIAPSQNPEGDKVWVIVVGAPQAGTYILIFLERSLTVQKHLAYHLKRVTVEALIIPIKTAETYLSW